MFGGHTMVYTPLPDGRQSISTTPGKMAVGETVGCNPSAGTAQVGSGVTVNFNMDGGHPGRQRSSIVIGPKVACGGGVCPGVTGNGDGKAVSVA